MEVTTDNASTMTNKNDCRIVILELFLRVGLVQGPNASNVRSVLSLMEVTSVTASTRASIISVEGPNISQQVPVLGALLVGGPNAFLYSWTSTNTSGDFIYRDNIRTSVSTSGGF